MTDNASDIQSEEPGSNPGVRTELDDWVDLPSRKGISKEELREQILSDVKEFSSAITKEEKIEVMKKRKDKYVERYKEALNPIYAECVRDRYQIQDVDIKNIEPVIQFCETEEEKKAWRYLRIVASSLQYTGYVGRIINFFVKDKSSGCIIGICGLGSDFRSLRKRDEYIGWNREQKEKRLQSLMNIYTCVSLEPFNQLISGKLLAMSCFSDEVIDYFEKSYEEKLAGLTVTSIYGKSIQYDRIPHLKFLGLSDGVGTVQFSNSTLMDIHTYFKEHDLKLQKDGRKFVTQAKARMVDKVCRDIGLKSGMLEHKHRRGIYFGYTKENAKDFLLCKSDEMKRFKDRSMNELSNYWKERWMSKRSDREINVNDYIDKYNISNTRFIEKWL